MSRDRFSSFDSFIKAEQDPINLEVAALEGAMNAFMKRGFETLDEGIPEHLYELLASFAERVPPEDVRREAVLDLIRNSFYVTNEKYLSRQSARGSERVKNHQIVLAELMDLLDDPWQAVDLVTFMHHVVGQEEYRHRAWEKAVAFNTLSQDSTLRTTKAGVPSLEELHQQALTGEATVFLSDEKTFVKANPTRETPPPKNKHQHWVPGTSPRLRK